MTSSHVQEFVTTAMSTTVSVQIVGDHPNATALSAEALDWFRLVETACTRFDPASEVVRLCQIAPATAHVSPLLFEVLRLALAVATTSHGAFDPTVGGALMAMGFDRHWRTHEPSPTVTNAVAGRWRDIALDETGCTVTLPPATLLDLGGIAKGFALDLAARAMSGVANCCIVAGGDLLCRGHNPIGMPWRTGVTDPHAPTRLACTVKVDAPEFAVCTSGDYARRTPAGHHLLDTRARHGRVVHSADEVRSVTVVAPQAAIADALATAAFVLGPDEGATLLAAQQVDGYFIDAAGEHWPVSGWGRTTFSRCHA